MRRVVRHVLGWSCLLLGVAGLALPVLQGVLLIAIGALLLAPDIPLFARLSCWVENRFPRFRTAIQRLRERFRRDGGSVPPCP